MPRRVFDRLGEFDETLRDSEDLEFSDRLAPHYTIILTDRVVARHDEEYRLGPLLAERFRRALLLVPALASALRHRRKNLTANGLPSVIAAAFTLGLLLISLFLLFVPLPLADWIPPAVTGAGLVGFCVANLGLLHFVARHRGLGFVPFFVAVHLLVHCALLTPSANPAKPATLGNKPSTSTKHNTAPETSNASSNTWSPLTTRRPRNLQDPLLAPRPSEVPQDRGGMDYEDDGPCRRSDGGSTESSVRQRSGSSAGRVSRSPRSRRTWGSTRARWGTGSTRTRSTAARSSA